MSKLVEDTATGAHYIATSTTIIASTTYTQSIYLKAAERTKVRYYSQLSGTLKSCDIDLSTGTISSSTFTNAPTITSVGDNCWRVAITETSSSTSSGSIFYISMLDGSGNLAYTGNGYSGIFLWGAQLEALAFATSYIPTTTAQVTRAADNAVMTGTNFSSWYNQTQGTLYSEASTSDTFPTVFGIGDTTANNRIQMGLCPISGLGLRSYVVTSGVQQNNITVGNYTLKSFAKISLSCINGTFVGAFNGTASSTATGTIPVCTQAYIGQSNYGGNFLNGWIKKITYYPTALTSAQLQALTT
jgi:hypothetical protein